MKIEIVFKETNTELGVKVNDIYTYEKQENNIKTFANSVQIVNDFQIKTYTDEEWLENLINGLNDISIKYEIIRIKL